MIFFKAFFFYSFRFQSSLKRQLSVELIQKGFHRAFRDLLEIFRLENQQNEFQTVLLENQPEKLRFLCLFLSKVEETERKREFLYRNSIHFNDKGSKGIKEINIFIFCVFLDCFRVTIPLLKKMTFFDLFQNLLIVLLEKLFISAERPTLLDSNLTIYQDEHSCHSSQTVR